MDDYFETLELKLDEYRRKHSKIAPTSQDPNSKRGPNIIKRQTDDRDRDIVQKKQHATLMHNRSFEACV